MAGGGTFGDDMADEGRGDRIGNLGEVEGDSGDFVVKVLGDGVFAMVVFDERLEFVGE